MSRMPPAPERAREHSTALDRTLLVAAVLVVALMGLHLAAPPLDLVPLAAVHDFMGWWPLGAVPLLAFALARRSWVSAALVGLTLAVWVWLTLPLPTAGQGGESRFRLVLANVEYEHPDPASLAAELTSQEADVFAIIELTPAWAEHLEGLPGHHLLQVQEGPFGLGLYSPHPLRETRAFELDGIPALSAVVDAPQGPVGVLAVHLFNPLTSAGLAIQRRQVAELERLLPTLDGPWLLVGDLNMSRYHPLFPRLEAWGEPCGRQWTWPAHRWPRLSLRIDHVLTGPGVGCVSAEVLEAHRGDHRPVVVEVR